MSTLLFSRRKRNFPSCYKRVDNGRGFLLSCRRLGLSNLSPEKSGQVREHRHSEQWARVTGRSTHLSNCREELRGGIFNLFTNRKHRAEKSREQSGRNVSGVQPRRERDASHLGRPVSSAGNNLHQILRPGSKQCPRRKESEGNRRVSVLSFQRYRLKDAQRAKMRSLHAGATLENRGWISRK